MTFMAQAQGNPYAPLAAQDPQTTQGWWGMQQALAGSMGDALELAQHIKRELCQLRHAAWTSRTVPAAINKRHAARAVPSSLSWPAVPTMSCSASHAA